MLVRTVAAVVLAALAVAAQVQRPLPKVGARRPGFHPGRKAPPRNPARQNVVEHLMSLAPDQQQEFMRNNPRFRRLPPQQQENIQRRLEQFNRLPAERREALRERYELFRQLTPEQQDRARDLYRQWSQFPPGRRLELMRGFRELRDASPEERRQRMQSDEFRDRFNDREQDTLRGLVELLPEGS